MKRIPPDRLAKDLHRFVQLLEEIHPNPYAAIRREVFLARVNELEARLTDPMEVITFYQELVPLAALLQDEHVCIQKPEPEGLGRHARVPDPFSYERWGDSAVWFKYQAFEDPNHRFERFLDGMFRVLREQAIPNLILDLRGNPGGYSRYGDILLAHLTASPVRQLIRVRMKASDALKRQLKKDIPLYLRWLPGRWVHPRFRQIYKTQNGTFWQLDFEEKKLQSKERPYEGILFVLTDGGTLSSACIFAGTVKRYGLGKLIGETTGGGVSHFGCQYDYRLPESGLLAGIPCSINTGHYPGTLPPDLWIPRSTGDLPGGRDTMTEKMKELTWHSQNP